MARTKAIINQEVASIKAGRDITRGFFIGALLPQDGVLRSRGGDYKIYEEVLRDDQVCSAFQQRRRAVISREWEIVPGGSRRADKKAADFIQEVLDHVGWDNVTDKMLYGTFYGYAVAECLWMRDGNNVAVDKIKVKKQRRFRFDIDSNLRLLTLNNSLEGELLPERKFWHFCTGGDNDDEPYGLGLGHWLYWPVFFKRNGMKSWLIFLEKFGQPTAHGTYPNGASPEEQKKLLQALGAIQEDSGVVTPEGMIIKLLEAARSGTADYSTLLDKMNAAISKVVLSQTMTTDDGSSRSQSETHLSVRDDVVKSDSDLVNGSFNNSVVEWLCDWNYPDAARPKVWRRLDAAPDLDQQAQREQTIFQMGFRPTLKHVQDTYGGEWTDTQAQGQEKDSLAGLLDNQPVRAEDQPSDPQESPDFSEFWNFAVAPSKKKKTCKNGYNCGGACIHKDYVCRKALPHEAKTYAEWLMKKVGGNQTEAIKPQTSKKSKTSGAPSTQTTLPKTEDAIAPGHPPKIATQPTQPSAPKAGDFPNGLENLEVVKTLGGSTGAVLVRDPATGKLYVKKDGDSPEHIKEEAAADAAYQALGVNVPKHKLYDNNGAPVKLSEYVEGRTLQEVMAKGTKAEQDAALAELKKNFAADALLGNWDVVGMSQDNIVVGNDGKVWRVDNGGALRHRAQGEKKTKEQWNKYPTELWSMRDPSINSQSAKAFDGLSHSELVNQIDNITAKKEALLAAVPKELHSTIEGRIAEMERISTISKTLANDQFKDSYIGTFTKHGLGIRAAGITDKLPNYLTQVQGSVKVIDENGKAFDNLRGKESTMIDVQNYINKNGGNYEAVTDWMNEQGGSSWSKASQALKYHLSQQRTHAESQQRTLSGDTYFWYHGIGKAADHYKEYAKDAGGEAKYAESVAAFHAFNYELLDKTRFINKNSDNTITLVRTEDKKVMKAYKKKPGDTDVTMPRGVAESTSIYKPVYINGTTELTTQKVPLHRVIGTYFYEGKPGSGDTPFYGDHENEFIAMLEGIPFNYEKVGKTKK